MTPTTPVEARYIAPAASSPPSPTAWPIEYVVASDQGPIGGGRSHPHLVHTLAVAKRNVHPVAVTHELIVARLALALGAPVPVGGLAHVDGRPVFLSLYVPLCGPDRSPLPPPPPPGSGRDRVRYRMERQRATRAAAERVDARRDPASDPAGVAALRVLDAWTGHCGRGANNLAWAWPSDPAEARQPRLIGYDHEAVRLHRTGSPATPLEKAHCLTRFLPALPDGVLAEWIARAAAVPRFQIEDAVALAVGAGLDGETAAVVVDWLDARRQHLPALFVEYLEPAPVAPCT